MKIISFNHFCKCANIYLFTSIEWLILNEAYQILFGGHFIELAYERINISMIEWKYNGQLC